MVTFELLHPRMTHEHLGLIPEFLSEHDPRPAREQFDTSYISGWQPFNGFRMNPQTYSLTYPGDPPMKPVARATLRDETILFYPHDWIVVLQPDGSFEACRMD